MPPQGYRSINNSARSLRSIQTKSNASLRRSCLLSRSANASQTQVVTEAASDADVAVYRSGGSSPCLPQRRCQSLGKFPGEENAPRLCQSGTSSPNGRPPRQFLCVPQIFPSGKGAPRRRKESKSLDVFPSQLRPGRSDRSILQSCPSHEDTEDEHTQLLKEDNNIVITIPDDDDHQQQTGLTVPMRPNGHLKSSAYQAVPTHNDDEGIDSNSESSTGRVQQQRLSLTALELPEMEGKKWYSCEQLHHSSPDDMRSKEKSDIPIASIAHCHLHPLQPSTKV